LILWFAVVYIASILGINIVSQVTYNTLHFKLESLFHNGPVYNRPFARINIQQQEVMHDIALALSLLCIFFFIFKEQIRLYDPEPPTFWHTAYNGTKPVPLIVAPAATFGVIGQPLSVHCLDTAAL